ncbi:MULTISPECIES: adenylyl-sulfate kinase [Methylomonas]|uniref:Adenylyl-sulfate kinase n=1 Tax=Methylomonas koyamae TaxID=702114 RepID=A0A291ILF4_9GAMM|nr:MULTISPECIES: adenylyl-sulfate kinase [Methylomonas]ANE56298.1 adenylyl-sulfate kinase [Methylomonas sp. DH-1]ATG91215.1 adenylylsulfate kinase [Methylomonas koyamae]OAI21442.1 adenylyl-sulfate kinase [Methylomonas koyamae]
MESVDKHVVWHHARINRAQRAALNGHRSAILWFTGLSGAGKSTLAHAVEERLHELGCRTFVLDGDNVRQGLCADLGFSDQDRRENIRRIAEVAKLMLEAGIITLTAFISPFQVERLQARQLVAANDFIEIYCSCDLAVCEQRDTKGLYQKARQGEIKWFTGISSPYEVPLHPDLIVETGRDSLDDCVDRVMEFLAVRGVIELPTTRSLTDEYRRF